MISMSLKTARDERSSDLDTEEDLHAVEDIRNLVGRYCDALSHLDLQAVGECWTDDGIWTLFDEDIIGRVAILAAIRELPTRIDWIVQREQPGDRSRRGYGNRLLADCRVRSRKSAALKGWCTSAATSTAWKPRTAGASSLAASRRSIMERSQRRDRAGRRPRAPTRVPARGTAIELRASVRARLPGRGCPGSVAQTTRRTRSA